MPPSAYDQAEKEGFNMKNKVKSKLLPQSTPEEWMEKKGNTGTKLNVLLCNLVDYVRGDDRPLVFAVMQEITEYFEQELDKTKGGEVFTDMELIAIKIAKKYKMHCEVTRGTQDEAVEYCKKDGNWRERGELRSDGGLAEKAR